MTTKKFTSFVWQYYAEHGRHELPWRLSLDPYAILVSEVMLQQTQVERVIPKFEAWLAALPDFAALANALLSQVLELWQGLGYNRRALALQRVARRVLVEYDGELPRGERELLDLPGIGPYTAGAIRAFAFNEPVVMLETNIRAVFLHHYYADHTNISDDLVLSQIEATLDHTKPREWYWALMDYGAYIKKQHPNPNRRSRHYTRQSQFQGSNRQVRGALIRALTKKSPYSEKMLVRTLAEEGIEETRLPGVLEALEKEGFVVRTSGPRATISLVTARESI